MKPRKSFLIWLCVILSAASWVAFVWPTPYRYFKQGSINLRVNRFTGGTERLYTSGWR